MLLDFIDVINQIKIAIFLQFEEIRSPSYQDKIVMKHVKDKL